MQQDLLEGDFAGQPNRHHDHPCDPEEEDVVASFKQLVGEERGEVRVLGVGPLQGREGEEARTEPSVQNVSILLNLYLLSWQAEHFLSLLCGFLKIPGSDPVVGRAILLRLLSLLVGKVSGNAVSPPQLPGDAPILQVLHPPVPSILFLLRMDDHLPVLDDFDHPVGDVAAFDVPLRLDQGLNDVVGARAEAQSHLVVLLLNEEAQLLELLLDDPPAFEPLHAFELPSVLVDQSVLGEEVDELQLVPLSACVIVVVVGRSDLDATSPELAVDHLVSDDDYPALGDEGMNDLLSNQILEARVLGVHGYRSIAQHRLNSSRGDLDELSRVVLERVLETNDDSELDLLLVARNLQHCPLLDVDVLDLNVGDGRLQHGRPVYQSIRAVDQSHLEQSDEALGD